MLEKDIDALNAHEPINLEGLEADIWRRERKLASLRSASRSLASWQGAVLLLAVICSAAIGMSTASKIAKPTAPLAEENLAPSALLMGSHG